MHSVSTKERWISTPRGCLFAKCWGAADARGPENAPIVLFHDSLGCVELWRDFPARLSQATGRGVIAYDRLGFGKSDPHPGRLDFDFINAEAGGSFVALLDQLQLEHFVAFGHSVGGAMAAVCAAAFPARCRALTTESAQAFVEDRTLDGIRNAKRAFAQAGQLERLQKYHGDKAAWVLGAWVDTWLAGDFRHWNLDNVLPLVRCPVLAMHGDRDEYGSVRHPERITALAAGPVVTGILADCGHVPHREKLGAVINAVVAFLA